MQQPRIGCVVLSLLPRQLIHPPPVQLTVGCQPLILLQGAPVSSHIAAARLSVSSQLHSIHVHSAPTASASSMTSLATVLALALDTLPQLSATATHSDDDK